MKSSKRVVRGRIDGQLLNGGKGGAFTITIIIKYGSLLLHFYTKRFIVNAYVMQTHTWIVLLDVFVTLSLTIQYENLSLL